VAKLIEFASIMNKTFYVVVPYSPFISKEGFMQKITNLINPIKNISFKKQEFEAHKEELLQTSKSDHWSPKCHGPTHIGS
jgi:hypothetical protein